MELENIYNDILECMICYSDQVEGETIEERKKSAEKQLLETFSIAGVDSKNPDLEGLYRVAKLIAAKELGTGKDIKVISDRLAKLLKTITEHSYDN